MLLPLRVEIFFKQFEPQVDSEALAKFLLSQEWPFHVHSTVTEEQIHKSIRESNYSGTSNQTFWINTKTSEHIGIIKLFELEDLDDGSPLFDIRILNKYQGKGFGQIAVKWLTRYLFEGHLSLNRIEGTTRADNLAMRKVFLNCGFVKEGHYRKSWTTASGHLQDTVRYSILRSDWQSGITTPVNWND